MIISINILNKDNSIKKNFEVDLLLYDYRIETNEQGVKAFNLTKEVSENSEFIAGEIYTYLSDIIIDEEKRIQIMLNNKEVLSFNPLRVTYNIQTAEDKNTQIESLYIEY